MQSELSKPSVDKAAEKVSETPKIKKALVKFFSSVKDKQRIAIAFTLTFGQQPAGGMLIEHLADAWAQKATSVEDGYAKARMLLSNVDSLYLDPDLWFAWFSDNPKASMWLWQVIFNQLPVKLAASFLEGSELRLEELLRKRVCPRWQPPPNSPERRIEEILDFLVRLTVDAEFLTPYSRRALLSRLRSEWESRWSRLIAPRAWEKKGPSIAAQWALDILLEVGFGDPRTQVPGDSALQMPVRSVVSNLNFHYKPTTDKEALLVYYGLAWQLHALDPHAAKNALDKCATLTNQRVRRFNGEQVKRQQKKTLPSSVLTKKRGSGGSARNDDTDVGIPSFSESQIESMPLRSNQTIFVIYEEQEIALREGHSNVQLDELLEIKGAEAGFFVFADSLSGVDGKKLGISQVQAVFSLAVEKAGATYLAGVAYDPTGQDLPRHGFFVIGRSKSHTCFVVGELTAKPILWCERNEVPVFM